MGDSFDFVSGFVFNTAGNFEGQRNTKHSLSQSIQHIESTKGAESTGSHEIDMSVIIVNYNVKEFLEQAIRSIYQAIGSLQVEVFVVDNNSVDGSVEMVRARFPQVHLIANEENTGFSTANNQAIRLAKGRHLFILNPDTIVQENTLTTLVEVHGCPS